MSETYDVVVIGAGPAGENAAGRCAKAGLRTLIVERELAGGECSYWACIPSKTLLRPGEVLAAARRVPGAREAITGELDVAAALARRDWMVNNYDDVGQVKWITDTGIEFARGHARFAGPKQIVVETADGTRAISAATAVVVATGSEPVIPPVDGLSDIRIWDSRGATEAKHVPSRLLVIGGGVVACEMAQAWRRLGAEEVTIVERGEHLLSREEPFVGEELRDAFEAEGIHVLTRTSVKKVVREADDAPIVASFDSLPDVVADEVLVAIGRRPRTSDLGVETIGLEPGRAIEVDDHLRSTEVDGGWLYAIGDANRRALLTHMGKYQAKIAADNIAGGDVEAVADHKAVTRVVFTDPQVAAVGLTERQAREAGIEVEVYSTRTADVAGATVSGEDVRGTCRLVVDGARRVIVGATFTGPAIGDLLHSATIAIAGDVPLERLRHAVPAFPSISEVWLNLIDEALGTGA